MKVETRVTGSDLTEGIGFYGETKYDKTIDRLRQLTAVAEDVAYDLADLNRQEGGRFEASARAIKRQLDTMRNNVLLIIFDEETAGDIIKLLKEEE